MVDAIDQIITQSTSITDTLKAPFKKLYARIVDQHNFHMQRAKESIAQNELPTAIIADAKHENILIPFGGNITCTTAGGAKIISVVDICLDQHFAVAKTQVERSLEAAMQVQGEFIPFTFMQVMTSHTAPFNFINSLGSLFIHADYQFNSVVVKSDTATPQLSDSLKPECKFDLQAPIGFGKEVEVSVFEPVKLQVLSGELVKKIFRYNTSAFRSQDNVEKRNEEEIQLAPKNYLRPFA